MPKFTLHRNFVLRTTKGHAIAFVKGQPVEVPNVCVPDAVAIGAVAVNSTEGDVLGDEPEPEVVLTPAERKAKVFEAFKVMEERAERSDFTGNGMPDNRRIPAILGFEITKKERDTYWQNYRDAKQAALEEASMDRKVSANAEAG